MAEKKLSAEQQTQLVASMRQEEQLRQMSYREQALKLYPHVCGRCTREFTNKNLRELTVHHRDHNHDNNPADGSNWELLCVYCHDHEHTRNVQEHRTLESPQENSKPSLSHSPFAKLGETLNNDK